MDFQPWSKMARFSREIIITEKLDGTNAQVAIDAEGNIKAGSRTRWITPDTDNFGFARWVEEHRDELLELGPGRHYGEWWGCGIQRGYGLSERRFSLFNTHRWNFHNTPDCCEVVPVLYQGIMDEEAVWDAVHSLATEGSRAANFMDPEGIIIFHTAAGIGFKKTLKDDEKPKGL